MGMTQRQFAAAINGLDTLAISRWERGVSLPRQENLQALAKVTGREVAWFYTEPKTEKASA
jgi:transcriptional regulator with XRE-family HTH domain